MKEEMFRETKNRIKEEKEKKWQERTKGKKGTIDMIHDSTV